MHSDEWCDCSAFRREFLTLNNSSAPKKPATVYTLTALGLSATENPTEQKTEHSADKQCNQKILIAVGN